MTEDVHKKAQSWGFVYKNRLLSSSFAAKMEDKMKKYWQKTVVLFVGAICIWSCAASQHTVAEQETVGTISESISENIPIEDISIEAIPIETIPIETMSMETDPIEESQELQTAAIVMIGDVLLHTNINDSGLMEDGSYCYDHLFTHVKEKVQKADLALVNQEVILGGRELGLSGYPAFNGAYEVGDSLAAAGFDVILHATNHALDKGKKGLLNCKRFWKEQYPDISVVGIYESQEEADNICVTEVNGIRIAVLNYTYGTNGIALPGDMPYIVDLWEEEKIAADVEKAKAESDFIVVCPHWGTEYTHKQTREQEEKAQFLAKLGVDLVIGTHPHVIEPVEWVAGEEGHQMLTYYSIGNFINATSGTGAGVADRMVGAMAEITVAMEDGEAYIKEYGVTPLITQMLFGSGQITTYPIEEYTPQLAAQNEIIHQDSHFSLEYCKKICREVFGDLYQEAE